MIRVPRPRHAPSTLHSHRGYDRTMNDTDASIRAAVAGAPGSPTPLPPRRDDTALKATAQASLSAANTKPVGFGGVALVIAANVLPLFVPNIDRQILAAHVPPLAAHAAVATVGAVMALLGRWRTFQRP